MPKPLITRRRVLTTLGAAAFSGLTAGGYAFAVEPHQTGVTRYRVSPVNWPSGLNLRIAAIADLHASEPVMPPGRIEAIVDSANKLGAHVIVLLGDFVVRSTRGLFHPVPDMVWAKALSHLKAPLGVHAILGNHDWWADLEVQRRRSGVPEVQRTLEQFGIPVYHNHAMRLRKGGEAFWLAGLGDQWAYYRPGGRRARPLTFGHIGADDLGLTLSKVTDAAPVILLAHEPDVFVRVPNRVALTLSGHTHGGQVRLFGYSPVVPSVYGNRFAYGHVVEGGRHLIVSGGLGCSMLPIRLGTPPELVVIDVAAAPV